MAVNNVSNGGINPILKDLTNVTPNYEFYIYIAGPGYRVNTTNYVHNSEPHDEAYNTDIAGL